MPKSPTWSRTSSKLIWRCAIPRRSCSSTRCSASASNLSRSGSMPLVKNGHIATDIVVQAADVAELPGDGPLLDTAARFLEDPEALRKRSGKVGVIWPNNRDLDDLVPYLDRLALVALVFPTFRDGRAYSQ